MKKKSRLDNELIRRGILKTKEEAIPYIMSGEVLVNGNIELKSDFAVYPDDEIVIKKKFEYVSRGALKLKKAFTDFKYDPSGKNVVDIGISNGGFTDLVLKMGAKKVMGVDVNINQVDYKIRNSDRVVLLKKNARYIAKEDLIFNPQLVIIDVSFISVLKILDPLRKFGPVDIISLIKPQFEVSRIDAEKGGVIRNEKKRAEILIDVKNRTDSLGYSLLNFTKAGIQGRKGNQEYFFYLKYKQNGSIDDKIITNGI